MRPTTVRDWMMDLVVFIDPDQTVVHALEVMRRRYIHSLIVNRTDASPHYGIITSMDICDKIVAQQRNPTTMRVSEIMNSPLVTVHQDALLKDCACTMKELHIHHLPVVDDSGELVGMISATDFLVAAEAMGYPDGERNMH